MALLSYNTSNKPKFSQKLHHVEIHNTFLRNAQFHWPYTPIRPNLKINFLNNLQYMVNLEKNQNFYHVIRHAQRTSCWYFLQKSFVFIFNSKFQLKTHSQANSKTVSQHENIPNNNFVSLIPFFFSIHQQFLLQNHSPWHGRWDAWYSIYWMDFFMCKFNNFEANIPLYWQMLQNTEKNRNNKQF